MIKLLPLQASDQAQFIKDNQWAFKYGSMIEFGERNTEFEEPGEIISRQTIIDSIEEGTAYRIWDDEQIVGGVVIHTDGKRGYLDLLFTDPKVHSQGVGYQAWCEIEKMYPEIEVWETFTPYFETRNIHFYVNKCGFKIVEFFNPKHPEPDLSDDDMSTEVEENPAWGLDFRFEKHVNS